MTTIDLRCPDCGHGTARFQPSTEDGAPDVAVCDDSDCGAEWELVS